MFYYFPKGFKELPYYDQFPIIFPIGPAKNGFLGINMHYLPPYYRAKLMDALYLQLVNVQSDERRLRISYRILNSAAVFRYYKPCIKHYLFAHVRSKFFEVPSQDWEIVLMLPTERFIGANKQKVWQESVRKLGYHY